MTLPALSRALFGTTIDCAVTDSVLIGQMFQFMGTHELSVVRNKFMRSKAEFHVVNLRISKHGTMAALDDVEELAL